MLARTSRIENLLQDLGGVPAQDELPQVFETSETIVGRVAWNRMRVTPGPDDQTTFSRKVAAGPSSATTLGLARRARRGRAAGRGASPRRTTRSSTSTSTVRPSSALTRTASWLATCSRPTPARSCSSRASAGAVVATLLDTSALIVLLRRRVPERRAAVAEAQASPDPEPADAFTRLYAKPLRPIRGVHPSSRRAFEMSATTSSTG